MAPSDRKSVDQSTDSASASSESSPELSPHERMQVGVFLERRPTSNPWQEFTWRPTAVVAGAPAAEPWSLAFKEGPVEQYFAGTATLELNRRETDNYLLNLATAEPSVYVVVRVDAGEAPHGVAVKLVTVSPAEAEAYMEGGEHIIERVALPEVIAEWVADYCAAFHVVEKFYKRKRKRHDPLKGFGRGSGHNDYGPSSAQDT